MPTPQEIRTAITQALGRNDLAAALDLLEHYDGTLLDYRFTVKIITLRSEFVDTQDKEQTLQPDEYSRRRAVTIAGAMEVMDGIIKGLAAPRRTADNPEDRELTADQARQVLGVFLDKKQKLNRATEAEMTELANLGGRLYDVIFQDLNDRIATNPELAATRARVSFNNIITARELGASEKIFLQNIRHGKGFTTDDRMLVVSALSLSATAAFDLAKVHLLCDFVADGEDGVWDRALVGLVLCLLRYDNKVPFFPDLIDRLKLFQGNSEVQRGIYFIQNVLQSGSYSPKRQLLNIGREGLLSIIGSVVTLEESFGPDVLKEVASIKGAAAFFDLDALNERLAESGQITFKELLETVRIEQLLDVYEDGVFGFDVATHPILSEPPNWFVPFAPDSPLVRQVIMEAEGGTVDYQQLVAALEQFPALTDIDKFQLLLLAPVIDPEILEGMLEIPEVMAYMQAINPQVRRGMDTLAQRFVMILRNMDRFIRLFPKDRLTTLLEANYSLNSTNLLEAIGEANNKLILNGNLLFERQNYAESLRCFEQALETAPDDLILITSARNCASRLENWELTEAYYLRELELRRRDEAGHVEDALEASEGLLSVKLRSDNAEELLVYLTEYRDTADAYLNELINGYKDSESDQTFALIGRTVNRLAFTLNSVGARFCNMNMPEEGLAALFHALGTYGRLGDYDVEGNTENHRVTWRNVAAALALNDYSFVDSLEREAVLSGLAFDHLQDFFVELIPALQLGVLIYVRHQQVGELLVDLATGADTSKGNIRRALEDKFGAGFIEKESREDVVRALTGLLEERLRKLADYLVEHNEVRFSLFEVTPKTVSIPMRLVLDRDVEATTAFLLKAVGEHIRWPVIQEVALRLKTIEGMVPEVRKALEGFTPLTVSPEWVTAKALEMILSLRPYLGGDAGAGGGALEGK